MSEKIYILNRMIRKIIVIFISLSMTFLAQSQETSINVIHDTSDILLIDSVFVSAKPDFEFNSIRKISKDTLELVICSKFVYFPFGKIENETDLKKSQLTTFKASKKRNSNGHEVRILKFQSSKLILFLDDDSERTVSSYIVKGEIVDPEIKFINDIRIGMTKEKFFELFFDTFPVMLAERCNEIGLIACVDGTNHYYSFKNNKLYSVRFECPVCTWKIDFQ